MNVNYNYEQGYGRFNRQMNTGDRCSVFDPTSELPKKISPTMMYVPFQTDTTVYDEMKALEEGTLFPVLNKPFMAGAGCCK